LAGGLLAVAGASLVCASGPRKEGLRLKSPPAVLIGSGWFTMGSTESDLEYVAGMCALNENSPEACSSEMFRDELPAHRVFLSTYRMDRTEVSNRAYRLCVLANRCAPPRISDLDERIARPEQPVTGVAWVEAERYCRSKGGRLPTEAEWERAAKGTGGRRFPWGNFYNDRLANHGQAGGQPDPVDGYRFAAPVDSYPDGGNERGLRNLAGNVWELTADWYAPDYYRRSERVDPKGPPVGTARAMRGGSWRSPAFMLRVTQRASIDENEVRLDVGFRCAYDFR
jgi:formylglycine-generating enzyme required for sulfatase activity